MTQLADISLSTYERMIEAGVFDSDEAGRVELVRGRITKMTPINFEHANTLAMATDWSYDSAPRDKVLIRVQTPILLTRTNSAPQPDLFWIAKKDYSRHATAPDIRLLIEVSDSTVSYDLGEKADLYAEEGIEDYWVVNIPARAVHVHRQPQGNSYTDVAVYHGSDEIRPLRHPHVVLTPAQIFDL